MLTIVKQYPIAARNDTIVINLTGHEVHDLMTGTIYPKGSKVRLMQDNEVVGMVNGTPIYRPTNQRIVGMPKLRNNVIYIVSALCLNALADRPDVVAPRNPQKCKQTGKVHGCLGFRQL